MASIIKRLRDNYEYGKMKKKFIKNYPNDLSVINSLTNEDMESLIKDVDVRSLIDNNFIFEYLRRNSNNFDSLLYVVNNIDKIYSDYVIERILKSDNFYEIIKREEVKKLISNHYKFKEIAIEKITKVEDIIVLFNNYREIFNNASVKETLLKTISSFSESEKTTLLNLNFFKNVYNSKVEYEILMSLTDKNLVDEYSKNHDVKKLYLDNLLGENLSIITRDVFLNKMDEIMTSNILNMDDKRILYLNYMSKYSEITEYLLNANYVSNDFKNIVLNSGNPNIYVSSVKEEFLGLLISKMTNDGLEKNMIKTRDIFLVLKHCTKEQLEFLEQQNKDMPFYQSLSSSFDMNDLNLLTSTTENMKVLNVQVIDLSLKSTDIIANLKKIYEKDGNFDNFKQYLKKCSDKFQNSPNSIYKFAEISYLDNYDIINQIINNNLISDKETMNALFYSISLNRKVDNLEDLKKIYDENIEKFDNRYHQSSELYMKKKIICDLITSDKDMLSKLNIISGLKLGIDEIEDAKLYSIVKKLEMVYLAEDEKTLDNIYNNIYEMSKTGEYRELVDYNLDLYAKLKSKMQKDYSSNLSSFENMNSDEILKTSGISLSKIEEVDVYELDGIDFDLNFHSGAIDGSSARTCCTYISNLSFNTFSNHLNGFVFNKIDENNIIDMSPSDFGFGSDYANKQPMRKEDLNALSGDVKLTGSYYNEVRVEALDKEGKVLRPTAILSEEEIGSKGFMESIRIAKKYNIPIYHINRLKYENMANDRRQRSEEVLNTFIQTMDESLINEYLISCNSKKEEAFKRLEAIIINQLDNTERQDKIRKCIERIASLTSVLKKYEIDNVLKDYLGRFRTNEYNINLHNSVTTTIENADINQASIK